MDGGEGGGGLAEREGVEVSHVLCDTVSSQL